MAMIDYGAIAWKDGKLISTDMFTPMEDMVGWSDKESNDKYQLYNNYFAYIGDKEFTIAFYKSNIRICSPDGYYNERVYFGSESFYKWKYWERTTCIGDEFVTIRVKKVPFHNYYICKMYYRGHKYKVAFGYGVDLGYYKRFHIIDYYGTPWFIIKERWRELKYNFNDEMNYLLWRFRHKNGKS